MSVLPRRLILSNGLISPFGISSRFTSAGPPPATPSKPGSISDKYDKFISRWPKVHAVHRMVVDGSRWCFSDIKTYVKVRRSLSSGSKSLTDLSTSELEVLIQTPAEGPKLAVVLTLLPLPFTVYIIGFAIIFFPRLVLTRHFWSDSQRKEFFLMDVKKSMEAAGGISSALGQPSTSVNRSQLPKFDDFKSDLTSACGRLHGLIPLPGVGTRLKKRVDALRILDKKLAEELHQLTIRQLYFHLFIRRIDYAEKSEEECRKCLKEWIKFTSGMDDANYVLAPFFFNVQKKAD